VSSGSADLSERNLDAAEDSVRHVAAIGKSVGITRPGDVSADIIHAER
jgi:hypothetical protein